MNIKNIVLNLKKMDASRRSRFQSPAQRQFLSPSIVNRLFSPRNTRVNERFFSKRKRNQLPSQKKGYKIKIISPETISKDHKFKSVDRVLSPKFTRNKLSILNSRTSENNSKYEVPTFTNSFEPKMKQNRVTQFKNIRNNKSLKLNIQIQKQERDSMYITSFSTLNL